MTRLFRSTVRAGLAAGTAAVLWGALVERRLYTTRFVTVPDALRHDGVLRILHISDIHLTRGQSHREQFIRQLAALPYDVVVATGDLLGGPAQEQRCAEMLAALTTTRPGVMVLGSHDLYASTRIKPWEYFTRNAPRPHGVPLDTERFLAQVTSHGWTVLRGGTCRIDLPVGAVQFGGFDDPHLDSTVWPSVDALAVADDVADVAASVGVVHAPYTKALDLLAAAGYDVLFAGHTHGGQVRLPLVGALTVNCDLPRQQGRGLSQYAHRWLHVSAGVGHDPSAPYRFACRPEVSLVTLHGPTG